MRCWEGGRAGHPRSQSHFRIGSGHSPAHLLSSAREHRNAPLSPAGVPLLPQAPTSAARLSSALCTRGCGLPRAGSLVALPHLTCTHTQPWPKHSPFSSALPSKGRRPSAAFDEDKHTVVG